MYAQRHSNSNICVASISYHALAYPMDWSICSVWNRTCVSTTTTTASTNKSSPTAAVFFIFLYCYSYRKEFKRNGLQKWQTHNHLWPMRHFYSISFCSFRPAKSEKRKAHLEAQCWEYLISFARNSIHGCLENPCCPFQFESLMHPSFHSIAQCLHPFRSSYCCYCSYWYH